MMTVHTSAYAYLVKSWLVTSSGAMLAEPDTICFDLDLALDMADSDRGYTAGLSVYALGADGQLLADFPLMSHGSPAPAGLTEMMPHPRAAVA
ncbi:hypothetical protein [Aquabacter spiritensis]|uniref:Uncharacterized protein n=1 Tax=Aquabacter spiritensis TaxID=933073 RepID=A0A4R3LQX7_9HYPH|nr:hypothetical protein [Aquabacter spiritensis]TCT02671.1 hypothetical protein EDC64_112106 [Aquabacter spiritensis]